MRWLPVSCVKRFFHGFSHTMFTHVARFNPYKPYPECIEDEFGCGHIEGIEYQPYPECLEDHLGCDPCDYNCRKGVEEMIEAEEKKSKAAKVRLVIFTLIYLYPLPFWLKYKWDKLQTTESSDTKKWHHGIFNALKDDKEKEVCLVCLVLPGIGWASLYGIGCKAVCCGNRSDCASDFFCFLRAHMVKLYFMKLTKNLGDHHIFCA